MTVLCGDLAWPCCLKITKNDKEYQLVFTQTPIFLSRYTCIAQYLNHVSRSFA